MIKNFFNVAGADAVKRIAEWIRQKFYTKAEADNLLGDKVDKESGKGLSTEDYTTAEKTKLGGIEAGAEVNVQSDWNQSDNTKDDYIKNKPTLRQPSTDGTSGQYLKSNGNGNAPSWETMDSAPTDNSTKAVTSGGVKTALDGKQASITIATNANTPTDNDTVIMQDSGNTGTTSFIRRTLSKLWDYIKGKADEVYVPFGFMFNKVNVNGYPVNKRLYDVLYDDALYGADVRFDVSRTIYNDQDEVIATMPAANLFKAVTNRYANHPAEGEREVILIQPKSHLTSDYIFTYGYGDWVLDFDYNQLPNNVKIRFRKRNEEWTQYYDMPKYAGTMYRYSNTLSASTATYLNAIEVVIYGKNTGNNTTSAVNFFFVSYRPSNGRSGITKHSTDKDIYGNVTAPKFIMRGGTASQALLADGTTLSLPVPVNKGGTGSTTAIGAEYNILNQVADISTTLSDTRKIALCNQTKSASNGVFRWIALSNVWTWIKTHFDSSPTSGSGNGITSGGVYSALEEKVNLQPDFTASQIDYSAGNVGKWQKVLRFPEGADLVINMKKTAMGSDSTSTLWFSSSSMGDSYTSLFGNHSVRFVHDGGYVFLVIACRKSTNEPIESYTFQIAHSSVPMSDIVAVTEASPITATPNEPNIVYRAPMTTGAVSFNVTSGAGSVSMSGHNDFVGNMTSEATNGVTVTMSGATEGQIYRFVFTRNITGGVTFKQSNVAYCNISGDVNAGDTITLTAVSNTADGWLYEQESAGIESSDGSNIIEYNGSTADVRVNWEKLPKNIVRNNAYSDTNGHRDLAIGRSATAGKNALAVGIQAQASNSFAVAVGVNANASNSLAVAVGVNANAEEQGCVAVGYAKALGSYSFAGGMRALAYGFSSIATGYYAEANNTNSIAHGNMAFVCKRSVDANDNVKYRRFRAMSLQSFTVDGEKRKFYKPATAGDVTITFSGGQTATVNVTNGTLFVVSDSYAPDITSIFNGIMIDGRFYDTMDGTISLSTFTVTPISGLNAWAIDIKMPLAYIDTSEVDNAQLLTEILSAYSAEGCAFGSFAKSYGGYALGRGAVTTFPRQTVVGQYNVPSDSDCFQVGYGNGDTQRRNILTIDSDERLRVRSYVGETQTIDMSQQTGSLSNITKAVYRIRWNDTGTVTLTLQAGGCVEGQRVTIYAETNDVHINGCTNDIPQGRFADFLFVNGAWRPMVGY